MDITLYRTDIAEMIGDTLSGKTTDPTQVEEICQKLIDYGIERRDDTLEGYGHYARGRLLLSQNDIPGFYLEMLGAMKPFSQARNWEYMARVYNYLGLLAIGRGNLPLAMEYYFKSYEYCCDNDISDVKIEAMTGIGNVYFLVGDYEEALHYLGESHKYIANHPEMDNYVDALNEILLALGKTHFARESFSEAIAIKDEITNKTLAFLDNTQKIKTECFFAKIHQHESNEEGYNAAVHSIAFSITKPVTLLIVFNDLYGFLDQVLKRQEFVAFESTMEAVKGAVADAGVKNMEMKLLELRLALYKESDRLNEYHELAVKYIELVSQMEIENAMMVSSMVALRKNYFQIFEELKDERVKSMQLKQRAESDPLTGIPNRIKLNDYAPVAFDRCKTNEIGFAIELLDIDYFNEYTDNYGHHKGDECLVFLTRILDEIRNEHQGTFCANYNGDTFVLIYEGRSEQEVFAIAKELKNRILDANMPNEHAEGNIKAITISQGIYWGMPGSGENVWEYLNEADLLLYKVKQKSSNSIMLGKAKDKDKGEKTSLSGMDELKPIITEAL